LREGAIPIIIISLALALVLLDQVGTRKRDDEQDHHRVEKWKRDIRTKNLILSFNYSSFPGERGKVETKQVIYSNTHMIRSAGYSI